MRCHYATALHEPRARPVRHQNHTSQLFRPPPPATRRREQRVTRNYSYSYECLRCLARLATLTEHADYDDDDDDDDDDECDDRCDM